MIYASPKLEVGKQYKGLPNERTMHFDQPFLVLKEVTREDYVKECVAEGISEKSLMPHFEGMFYYDISID